MDIIKKLIIYNNILIHMLVVMGAVLKTIW